MRTKDGERMGIIDVIANTCKHFTGTSKCACDKGIIYREGSYLPCFRNSSYSRGKCEFAEFLTKKEARAEVEQIEKIIDDGICPDCGSKLTSTIANGHGTISCPFCSKTLVMM